MNKKIPQKRFKIALKRKNMWKENGSYELTKLEEHS